MSVSNETCLYTGGVPIDLPVPKTQTYVAIRGNSTHDRWMVACCAPNAVRLVNRCYEACEVPAPFLNQTGGANDSTLLNFIVCLRENGRNIYGDDGALLHTPENRGSRAGVTLKRSGIWALFVSIVVVLAL